MRDQELLVRLAADGSGGVAISPQRVTGRSAYLCPSLGCLEKALRTRVVPRALGVALPGLNVPLLRERFSALGARPGAGDDGGTRKRTSGPS